MRRPRHGGFTLVELLIAMAVTLILIFALAQAFAIVGDTIATGRASIEMAGNLRTVAHRLQNDLQHATVSTRPWSDSGGGLGYFEILDGPSTDKVWRNPAGLYQTDPAVGDTMYGDVDDVIALTTRNTESPFYGTAYRTIAPYTWGTHRSTLAEVVWWIQFRDSNGDGVRNVGEPFLVYRRVMMIRPDLVDLPIRQLSLATNVDTSNPDGSIKFTFGDGLVITKYSDGRIIAVYPDVSDLTAVQADLADFYNNNDVSVRLIWQTPASSSVLNVRLACNSLADLTKRESRYAHVTILSDRPGLALPPVVAAAPYPALPGPAFPFRMDTNRRSVTSLYRNPKHGANAGEDVIVSDALAFDVQVFDPRAPLLNWDTGDALVPSDSGYFPTAWTPAVTPPTDPTVFPYTIGYGAFVDLGYGARMAYHVNASNWSLFSGMPRTKSGLYLGTTPIYDYCTWSDHYESNGIDEDGLLGPDQGTNGFDDPVVYVNGNLFLDSNGNPVYRGGVDDVAGGYYDPPTNTIPRGENETLPPYPVPLRGIQIRIRTWDPDSRQVRQATVVADFVPE